MKLLLLLLIIGADALIVYDCQDKHGEILPLDLTEPERCADPEDDFEKPFEREVQILQTDTEVPIEAHTCRLTITKKVFITYKCKQTVFSKMLFLRSLIADIIIINLEL